MKNNDIDIEKFNNLLKTCLLDGLEIIRLKVEDDKNKGWSFHFDYHSDYASISYFDNGLPSFYLSNFQKRDYSKILLKDNKFLDIESWKKYHEFFRETVYLKRYFKIFDFNKLKDGAENDIIEFYSRIYTFHFLLKFVDSYIHLNSFYFDELIFNNYFSLYINSIVSDKYEFDIIVPILCAKFDFEEFKITDTILIVRLSERQQLSRNIKKSNTVSVHEKVVGAATHAFLLKSWNIDNTDSDTVGNTIYDIGAYQNVIESVDRLFATLRLCTSVETGYSQILTSPTKSIRNFHADLLDMSIITERKYPEKFENYGWSDEVRTIKLYELERFNLLFEKLSNVNKSFAIKKLNSASIRKSDEDTILDITSALESLLTNDSKTEITYRLSIRAAQICKISKFKDLNARQVFELCKKLYDYRSAVIHGDTKRINKTKTISIQNSNEIEIIGIALDLLRHILKTILENEINGVSEIDDAML
ncbi:MAG: HEPN domain-containing protein [Fluviicola sp.]|nr:HEPN domain-containing protein [Fluviicola sp.]